MLLVQKVVVLALFPQGYSAALQPHVIGFGPVLLLLDQIKREKGVWWMPWQ